MSSQSLKLYCDAVKSGIINLGIEKGDILYISSNMSQILKQAQTDLNFKDKDMRSEFLNVLIDDLEEVVGNDGTLLFPMYNWDFCKGVSFCYKNTKSKVGILNNFVLENRLEFRRTRHPLYSFMVWGKGQEYLCKLDNQEAFGINSPFEYMDKNHAKQIALGVDMSAGITYVHYLEQLVQMPYRHHKFFLGEYVGEDGKTELRAYSQYVRDLSLKFEYILNDEFLKQRKVLRTTRVYGWKMSCIEFSDAKKIFVEDLKNGAPNIYIIENYDVKEHFEEKSKRYEIGLLKDYQLI